MSGAIMLSVTINPYKLSAIMLNAMAPVNKVPGTVFTKLITIILPVGAR